MAKISRSSVRKFVREHFGVNITDGGADEIAGILEGEASRISSFAVGNARKDSREKVTKKDIIDYVIKGQE
jgi:histone H3/H4